jgi:pyruvate formate lyase activating enzyme
MIKGLQKLTLLDFPGVVAATVFLGGCNLRCPFCHNASLVIPEKYGETIPDEEFFEFLESRKGRLQGVCVSGGEPTLYPKISDFLGRIKEMGYLVKLDTNGTRPEVLSELIEKGLVDYVAMDIKNSPLRYGETVGISDFDPTPIAESAAILMSGKVDFEFRTTVSRELHNEEDIENIRLIYHLVKEKGMTLQGARQRLKTSKGQDVQTSEVVDRLKAIREELVSLRSALDYLT